MVTLRTCRAGKQDGSPCGAPPLLDGEFCYMHSPEHAEEAAAARRTGGLRHRRERAIAVAFDIEGVATVPQLRRVLEIVLTDALGLENTVGRARVLLTSHSSMNTYSPGMLFLWLHDDVLHERTKSQNTY